MSHVSVIILERFEIETREIAAWCEREDYYILESCWGLYGPMA